MKYLILYFSIFMLSSCIHEEKQYYENGLLKSKSEMRLGKKNGKKEEYYSNGHVKSISYWKEDIQNGKSVFYYKNGITKSTSNWINGKLDGVSILFYDNGNIENIACYKSGILTGPHTTFYRNGKIKQQGTFREGVSHGALINYFEEDSGRIASVDYLVNFHGQEKNMGFIEYYPDGRIKNENTRIKLESQRDTIAFNDNLTIKISLVKPKYDSTKIITGSFDEKFYVKDSAKLDTSLVKNHEIILTIKPEKKGVNQIRGLIRNYGIIEKNLKSTKIGVLDRYFEFEYFVK